MRNIILILLLLTTFSYSVTHNVTPGNSLHDIINNAAIGDSIVISGGPSVYNLAKAATNMKKKVTLISLTNDTIEKALSFYNVITLNGDSCTIKNCNFRWRDSTASTGELIGLLGGNNYGGHFIYGNTFRRPSSVSYSSAKGIYISRTDSTKILPPTIFRNNYCDSVRIWFGTLFGNMPNNVTVDSNSFVNCRLNVGDKSITRCNYFYQGGDHNFFGDSLLIEWNYGGEFWSAAQPEYFGNDDNTRFTRGSIVRYNYLDSLSHNTVWDGTLGFDYYRNTHRTSRCSYFSHRDVASDSSKNVRIYENWMSGISSAQVIGMSGSGGIGSSDIRITRNLFHIQNYTPIQMYANIVNDTVDSSVFKYVTTMTNVDQVFDTIVNVNIKDYVLDTNKYQFLKQNIANNPLRFSNGRRVTPKEYLSYLYGKDSTASSISFACSLSTQFRYGGHYSAGRARAWLCGDTAQIVLQYATDTSGSLTTVNADTLVAGQNANISISGLPSSTKQFYRTISNGISSEATTIHDTTLWYSATTLSSGGGGENFDSTEITGDVDNKKECPQIIVQPESDTVTVGSDTLLSFIVQAFGSNLSYQWKFNGSNVGSNVNYYQRVGAKADSGKYVKCVITGDTCSAVTTDSVLVSVMGAWPSVTYNDLFMGHSMMEGAVPYYYELNHAHRTYQNLAVGGHTITQEYARADSCLTAFNPSRFFLWIGQNELSITDSATFDAEMASYFTTWKSYISKVKSYSVDSIYIVGLSPVSTGLTAQRAQNYKRFNTRLKDSCRTNNLYFIDIYDSLCKPGTDSLNPTYTTDGLHPNGTTAGAVKCAQLFTYAYIPTEENPPVITNQPQNVTVNDGSNASFSVVATNATGYQWYGNGELIPGATNSVYSFTATLTLSGSSIYCIVYNATDTVWSDTATLTVNALPKTPANITVEPVSDTVTAGQAATFFVTASGSGLTYQWYRNDSLIAGATNDTFTYTARSQAGNYTDNIYCLLTTDTTISTDTVQLLVNGIVFSQSTDTLKLVCSNNQNVESWQWYQNNIAISGATDSVLSVVVDSTSATKSVYYCEISNGIENKKVGDWTIERKANGLTVSRKNKYKSK